MKNTRVLFYFLVLPFLGAAQPTRYYVDQQANGSNNGNSWTDAFTNLHDALALSDPGDEIWVAKGTYYPSTTGNRNTYFQLNSGVKLYGGFSANEMTLGERDIASHPSILDGDIGVPGDSLDNSYNLLYLLNPDKNTLIDGFYFQHGQANNPNGSGGGFGRSGSALLIMAYNGIGLPVIRHCVFEHNFSQSDGGAVYINGGGTGKIAPLFEHCRFSYNWTRLRGNCVARIGGYPGDKGIDFYDCEFSHNGTVISGSVYLSSSVPKDTLDFVKCRFIANYKFNSGGSSIRATDICIAKDIIDPVQMNIDSTFFTKSEGFPSILGGIEHWCIATDPLSVSFPFMYFNIRNTVFIENNTGILSWENDGSPDLDTTASYKHHLENIVCDRNYYTTFGLPSAYSITVKNASFLNGIQYSAGIGAYAPKSVKLENSIINFKKLTSSQLGNRSFFLLSYFESVNDNTQVSISNCSFHNLPLFSISPNLTISNSIFDVDGYQQIPAYKLFDIPANSQVIYTHNLSNDTLPSYTSTWAMSNNIWATDPLFVAPDSNDLRLQPCSLAINSGDNGTAADTTDIAGNPRIQYSAVDMGAYEMGQLTYQTPPQVTGTCTGSVSGSANVSGVWACLPATYVWSHLPTQSNPAVTGLAAGTYTVTITDSKSRTVVSQIIVPELLAPNLIAGTLPVICGGTTGGRAAFLVQSAAAPFQFLWNDGSTDSLRTNLPAGIYAATITDANGCTSAGTAPVETLGTLTIGFDYQDISCFGLQDGAISIIPETGAQPFQWAWEDGTTFPGISGLGAGNYSGTLTDGLGCRINWQVGITEPDKIEAPAQITNASSLVAADGKIKLGISGGTGNWAVKWSNGQTGSEIKDLQVGFYTVTITDDNGCTQQFTYEVKWTVAVGDLSDGLVQVFPNPVVDRLWVRATGAEFEFLLTDINGSVRVQQQGLMEGSYCFSMSHLPAGVYFWEVLRLGQIVKVGKVVKIE